MARRAALATVAVAVLAAVAPTTIAVPLVAHADLTTVSGNTQRQGWVSNETALTPAAVTSGGLHKTLDVTLSGQVYAEPLVVGSLVIVATETDMVYAVDRNTGVKQWAVSLGTAEPSSAIGCSDLTPNIGITSTPVYDPSTSTIYVIARTWDGSHTSSASWKLHALSLSTGNDASGWPVQLGSAMVATNDSKLTFDPVRHASRPGLLLMGGRVFAGFASYCDSYPYQGWIASISTTNGSVKMWTAEPTASSANLSGTAEGGGIWMSGAGLMSDGAGRIFFSTGNGFPASNNPQSIPSPGASVTNTPLGESIVRVDVQPDGSLQAADFFAPHNAASLNGNDTDLASSGVTALPDSFGVPGHPHLLLVGSKGSVDYLLDRDSLGGMTSAAPDRAVAEAGSASSVFGRAAIWPGDGGYIYLPSENVSTPCPPSCGLDAYQVRLSGGTPSLVRAGTAAAAQGFGTGSPVVTSNGQTSGSALVWQVEMPNKNESGPELRTYLPVPQSGKLTMVSHIPLGHATNKFIVPTLDNGQVFIGTSDGHLLAYGLNVTTAPAAPTSLSASPFSSSQTSLSWTGSSGAGGYKIQRSPDGSSGWTQVGTSSSISFTDTGLVPSTTYSYRVLANNSFGDSPPSNVASATTTPAAPTSLSASPASSTQISLSWTASSGATGYKVQRSPDGSSGWNQVGTGSSTSFADSGLKHATKYYYRVLAGNGADSLPSNVASATTWAGSWSSGTSLPTNLTAPAVGAISGKVYVAGGQNTPGTSTTAAEVYDPATSAWSALPSMTVSRSFAGSGVINGKLYVVGGEVNADCNAVTGALEIFDTAASTWAIGPPLPLPRCDILTSTVAANSKLYVIGGVGRGFVGATNEVDVFDPTANGGLGGWSLGTPEPKLLEAQSAVAIGTTIYVAGGYDRSVSPAAAVTNVYAYDTVGGTWSTLPPMPQAELLAPAAAVGGKMYVLSTDGNSCPFTNNNQVYSPSANSWTTQAPAPTPVLYAQAAATSSQIFLVGGNTCAGQTNDLQIYSPDLPAPPTKVIATPANAAAWVTWSDGGAGETAPPPASWTVTPYLTGNPQSAVTVAGNRNETFIRGLTNGGSYTFTVAATDSNGTGTQSAPSSAVVPSSTTPSPSTILGGLSQPGENASDPSGNIYFTQKGSGSVRLSRLAPNATSAKTLKILTGNNARIVDVVYATKDGRLYYITLQDVAATSSCAAPCRRTAVQRLNLTTLTTSDLVVNRGTYSGDERGYHVTAGTLIVDLALDSGGDVFFTTVTFDKKSGQIVGRVIERGSSGKTSTLATLPKVAGQYGRSGLVVNPSGQAVIVQLNDGTPTSDLNVAGGKKVVLSQAPTPTPPPFPTTFSAGQPAGFDSAGNLYLLQRAFSNPGGFGCARTTTDRVVRLAAAVLSTANPPSTVTSSGTYAGSINSWFGSSSLLRVDGSGTVYFGLASESDSCAGGVALATSEPIFAAATGAGVTTPSLISYQSDPGTNLPTLQAPFGIALRPTGPIIASAAGALYAG